MLQLLALLQARKSWAGGELAARLGVTERTVRRDIDRLRTLGYPVEAVPGPYGGYRLGRGGTMPPLLLNDDEAVAVAIGLRSAIDGSVAGLEESAVSTLAKLEQLLPAHLARRVRSIHESTASLSRADPAREQVPAGHLVLLTNACSARERVRFFYRDKDGRDTTRLVEPLGVVRAGARWYLAARDLDRLDWRTFRLDRISSPGSVGTRFELTDPPDPVMLVTAGLASMQFPFRARIRMAVPLEQAVRLLPRTLAILDETGASTVADLGARSMERMVSYLAGLSPPCQVLDPPELRVALAAHCAAVGSANS